MTLKLLQIPEDLNNPGAPANNPDTANVTLDWGGPSGEFVGSDLVEKRGDTITRNYRWKFHDALSYAFLSKERGTFVATIPLNPYFINFQHIDHYIQGTTYGYDVEITSFYWDGNFTSSEAYMNVDYRFKMVMAQGTVNYYSGDKWKDKIIHPNDI